MRSCHDILAIQSNCFGGTIGRYGVSFKAWLDGSFKKVLVGVDVGVDDASNWLAASFIGQQGWETSDGLLWVR